MKCTGVLKYTTGAETCLSVPLHPPEASFQIGVIRDEGQCHVLIFVYFTVCPLLSA